MRDAACFGYAGAMNDFVNVRIPRNLYDALVLRASAQRRSATSQAALILENELRPELVECAAKEDKAA